MEVVDGHYTGVIHPPQTIGQGKADAVRDFLAKMGYAAADCHAYGDDISDLPMLDAVGHPVVVAGGRGLATHAASVGWPVLSPN
jgi:phosphoserine phosphatase